MPYRDPPLEHVVLAALEGYLSRDAHDPCPELAALERQVAARMQAVPLFRNLTETIFLAASGAYFAWDSDPPAPPGSVRPIDAAALDTTLLIATGAHLNPELAALLPRRPAAAGDCYACGGRERRADVGPCTVCHGLGWLVDDIGA